MNATYRALLSQLVTDEPVGGYQHVEQLEHRIVSGGNVIHTKLTNEQIASVLFEHGCDSDAFVDLNPQILVEAVRHYGDKDTQAFACTNLMTHLVEVAGASARRQLLRDVREACADRCRPADDFNELADDYCREQMEV